MDSLIAENSDWNTFNIHEYVKENLSGLLLLVVVFLIIYFVDYINRLNNIIYFTQSSIPGLITAINSSQKSVRRKVKKR
jgi:hypothetical protein